MMVHGWWWHSIWVINGWTWFGVFSNSKKRPQIESHTQRVTSSIGQQEQPEKTAFSSLSWGPYYYIYLTGFYSMNRKNVVNECYWCCNQSFFIISLHLALSAAALLSSSKSVVFCRFRFLSIISAFRMSSRLVVWWPHLPLYFLAPSIAYCRAFWAGAFWSMHSTWPNIFHLASITVSDGGLVLHRF